MNQRTIIFSPFSYLGSVSIEMFEIKRAYLEAAFFRKGSLLLFGLVIKTFFFQSNLDQTKSDCSTHEYCNLTKFGQDWTQNKKILSQGQKVVRTPF